MGQFRDRRFAPRVTACALASLGAVLVTACSAPQQSPPPQPQPQPETSPPPPQPDASPPPADASAAHGTLAPDAIRGVVRANMAALHTCHDTLLGTSPTAVGVVTVRFVIAPDGAVRDVNVVSNSSPVPSLSDCVTQPLATWHFPAPEGGPVTVTYPFSFTAATQPEQPHTIPAQAIRGVVRQNLAAIDHCYEQALAQTPTLAGNVVVRFVIGPTGAVTHAEAASATLSSPAVSECVLGLARAWRFPAPANHRPLTVTYPFEFAPGG